MSYNTEFQNNNQDLREILNTINELPDGSAVEDVISAIKDRATLGLHTDGLYYLFIDGSPVGNGISLPSGSVGDVVGNVDSGNNIVLNGDLPDGTYTVKYEMEDGSTVNIGNLVLVSDTGYTNLFDPSTATLNQRYSSTSGTLKAGTGYVASAKISLGGSVTIPKVGTSTNPLVLRIRPNGKFTGEASIQYFRSDGTRPGGAYLATDSGGTIGIDGNGDQYIYLEAFGQNIDSIHEFTVSLQMSSGTITAEDISGIIMTLNEEIV